MCATAPGRCDGRMRTHTAGHCRAADEPEPAQPHPYPHPSPSSYPQPYAGRDARPRGPAGALPPRPPVPPLPPHPPVGAWPYALPPEGGAPRPERRSLLVQVLCTVLCVPLLGFGALCCVFSPFATASCDPAGCRALFRAIAVNPCVLLASVLLLAGCWAVPEGRQGRQVLRTLLGAGALAAAVTAVHLYLHLPPPS